MQHHQTFYTSQSESSQKSHKLNKMLPAFPEFYQDSHTTIGKSSAL